MGFCGVVGLEGGAASMGARGRSGRAGVVLGWGLDMMDRR